MPPVALMTGDELLRTHVPDKHVELVRGVLVVREPAGFRHGDVTARLIKLLMDVVEARELGRVLAAGTGFQISADPDTVRAPDVAFISRERLPNPAPLGYPRWPRTWSSRCCHRAIAPARRSPRWAIG